MQWAARPILGRRLAIGDAAVHHNPIGGRGLAFALGSAFAAAAVLATWRDDPGVEKATQSYYESYVAAEVRRHLAFLGGEQPSPAVTPALPKHVRWVPPGVEGAVMVNGRVVPGEVVTLANGQQARWLGRLDLARLQEVTLGGQSSASVIAHLCTQGLCPADARSALIWALERGVIAPTDRTTARS